jgi:UDP-galactose transporter B1
MERPKILLRVDSLNSTVKSPQIRLSVTSSSTEIASSPVIANDPGSPLDFQSSFQIPASNENEITVFSVASDGDQRPEFRFPLNLAQLSDGTLKSLDTTIEGRSCSHTPLSGPAPTLSVKVETPAQASLGRFQWLFVPLLVAVMYACFLVHFTLQEGCLRKQPNPEDTFRYPGALVFIYNLFNVGAAIVMVAILRPKLPSLLGCFPFLTIAVPQQLSQVFAAYAQNYVNYPTLQLGKLAKPVAVLTGQLLFLKNQRIPKRRIVVVAVLTLGLAIFTLNGKFAADSWIGGVLIVGALICDAVYAHAVDVFKAGEGGEYVTMLVGQSWCAIMVFVARFSEICEAFVWIGAHPGFVYQLCLYGGSGALASITLYKLIALTDGLVIAIATTSRKFVTIMLSNLIYKHHLNPKQWVGVFTVFVALFIELAPKFTARRAKKED